MWLVETADSAYVIKQIVGDPDPAQRFAREMTALHLADQVEPPVVARVLASDAAERAMVLEHLVERRRSPAGRLPTPPALPGCTPPAGMPNRPRCRRGLGHA